MNRQVSAKWYIEEDGETKGPYTEVEIEILLKEGKIRGTSAVSGSLADDKTQTVNDFIKHASDPAYSLFNGLQFAKRVTQSFSVELAKTPLKLYKSKVGLLIGIGVGLLLILFAVIHYFESYDQAVMNPFLPPERVPATATSPIAPKAPHAKDDKIPAPRFNNPFQAPQRPAEAQQPIVPETSEESTSEPKKNEEDQRPEDDPSTTPAPEVEANSTRQPSSQEEDVPGETPIATPGEAPGEAQGPPSDPSSTNASANANGNAN